MANYPVTITNPGITTGQKNVIFVGSKTPNTLDIDITNNSGFDAEFETTTPLTLTFPSQIISEANVKNISFENT